jgi:hypothetical protein
MKRYVFLSLAAISAPLFGQIAGPNVNMVSGTQWPSGDPFLQRQNEPSIAVSSRNSLHLLAGSNDYRTVDLPGLPNGGDGRRVAGNFQVVRRGKHLDQHHPSRMTSSAAAMRRRARTERVCGRRRSGSAHRL